MKDKNSFSSKIEQAAKECKTRDKKVEKAPVASPPAETAPMPPSNDLDIANILSGGTIFQKP